jgi:hypothetical protein
MEITLTNGGIALIDKQDYPLISKYNWQVKEYGIHSYAQTHIRTDGSSRDILMHRTILSLGSGHHPEVHHINNNGLDNRRCNLLILSAAEHRKAHGVKRTNSSSPYLGVYWDKVWKRWVSAKQLNGERIHIGRFGSELESARAYDLFMLDRVGLTARLNFPLEFMEGKK